MSRGRGLVLTKSDTRQLEAAAESLEGRPFLGRLPRTPDVSFVRERPEIFVERLRKEDGGTIWLFGGGRLATALSDAGLIDEYLIVVQPVLLGDGIPLWRSPHASTRLQPASARVWADGLVELRYRRASEASGR